MRGSIAAFPSYDFYSTATLIRAYHAGPDRVRQSLKDLSLDQLRARPIPGKWSILEIVLHLLDSEHVAAIRVRLARAEPGSRLPGYDQDTWTAVFRHNESSAETLEDTLRQFELHRRSIGHLFDSAEPEDWTRCHGLHPEHGTVTLRNLLELYADHSERHVEQILERRARLGQPVVMESILEKRLY